MSNRLLSVKAAGFGNIQLFWRRLKSGRTVTFALIVFSSIINYGQLQDFPTRCDRDDIPWNFEYCLEYNTGMNSDFFEADADCGSRIKFLARVSSEQDEQDLEMYAKMFNANGDYLT